MPLKECGEARPVKHVLKFVVVDLCKRKNTTFVMPYAKRDVVSTGLVLLI